AFAEGRPISARRPGLVDQSVKWLRRQRRSVALTATAATATLLVVAAIVAGSIGYAKWRRSYVTLDAVNPPLVAEVFDQRGRSLSGPVTVPLQQPLAIPAGNYEVEVSAKDRFSQKYQMTLARKQHSTFELSLDDQLLWRTQRADCTYALVDVGSRHDFLLLDGQVVRYFRGTDGRLNWTADVSTLHQDANLAAPGFVWNWKKGDLWHQGFDELDQRPFPIGPASDLDGDGQTDVVLAGRHQAWLLAMSGRDGSVLWLAACGDDVRTAETQRSIESHGTVSAVWGTPQWIPDVNDDQRPDLLATLVDVTGQLRTGRDGLKERRWVEVISGADGKTLWTYEIPDSLFQLPAGDQPPYRMRWFYGLELGLSENNMGGYGSGEFARRSERRVCERSGRAVYMPHCARLVHVATGSKTGAEHAETAKAGLQTRRPTGAIDCVLVIAGTSVVRLDSADGQPLDPPADLGVRAGQPARWGDVDGDGVPELILLDQGTASGNGGQPGNARQYSSRVSVCSLIPPRILWQRDLEMRWPVRPRWHIPPPAWPVVDDLDGDGRCELLVPDGTSERQSPSMDTAPWGELIRLEGATGEVTWRRRIRCLDQCIDRFTTGPDVDGDGTRDVFSAVFWGNGGEVYVDATSGADGRPLYWLRRATRVAPHLVDRQLMGPLFWWSGDRDGLPLLAVPTTDGQGDSLSFSVACFS
ncbi:MAG: hypothetical protein JJ992_06930, partial [Planctomycetes bacterium]|nr:hypothetical protein [Planctomycetota bacterium]